MTTICAVKDPETGTVWLGSNNQHCRGDERVPSTHSKWSRYGGWAIANSGPTAHSFALESDDSFASADLSAIKMVIQEMKRIFVENEIKETDDDQDSVSTDFGAYFLAAHSSGVFAIDKLLTPHRIDDGEVWAHGSGCDFARGAFLAARGLGQSIEDSLRIAVEAAISCDTASPGSAIIEKL